MKRVVIALFLLVLAAASIADALPNPHYQEAELEALHARARRDADPMPEYSFAVTPLNIVTNYYDYMPGSYCSTPIQVMPGLGNAYMIFHGQETAGAQRREYLAYVRSNDIVCSTNYLGSNAGWEGYGSIALDPVTQDPLAAYHIDFGQPTARVDLTFDMWHMLGSPGLLATPFTVIDNQTMAGQITPFSDDSFVWPYVYIMKSPTYDTDGKRRVFIFTTNNTTHAGDPSENVLVAWTDFDTSDIEEGAMPNLQWNYYTFPILDAYNAGNPTWGRYTKSIAVGDDGEIAMIGYLNSDEFTDQCTRLTIFYNDNYGEGDWEVIQESARFPVDNPQNQDGSYMLDADEVFFDIVNSSHPHAVFDTEGRLHFICNMTLGHVDPADTTHYYWADFSYVKDIVYDPYEDEIIWQDLYPGSSHSGYDFPFIPWDEDQDGEVDEFTDEGDVMYVAGWPVFWWEWDDAFHENLFKYSINPVTGWMAAVWVDGLKSRNFNYYNDEDYADWAAVPEICISVSGTYFIEGRPDGHNWSEPIRLNALETPELAGMIPEYVYSGSYIENLGDNMGRLHLFFLDDASYGSSVHDNGPADGGMMKYCAIDIRFGDHGVADNNAPAWGDYGLRAYPNPFNPTTQVSFSLAQPGDVSVKLYNVRGQIVKTLTDGPREPGEHTLVWKGVCDSGAPAASGVYFARIEGPNGVQSTKLLLLK